MYSSHVRRQNRPRSGSAADAHFKRTKAIHNKEFNVLIHTTQVHVPLPGPQRGKPMNKWTEAQGKCLVDLVKNTNVGWKDIFTILAGVFRDSKFHPCKTDCGKMLLAITGKTYSALRPVDLPKPTSSGSPYAIKLPLTNCANVDLETDDGESIPANARQLEHQTRDDVVRHFKNRYACQFFVEARGPAPEPIAHASPAASIYGPATAHKSSINAPTSSFPDQLPGELHNPESHGIPLPYDSEYNMSILNSRQDDSVLAQFSGELHDPEPTGITFANEVELDMPTPNFHLDDSVLAQLSGQLHDPEPPGTAFANEAELDMTTHNFHQDESYGWEHFYLPTSGDAWCF